MRENNLAQSLLYNTPIPGGQSTTLDTTKVKSSKKQLSLLRQIDSNSVRQI